MGSPAVHHLGHDWGRDAGVLCAILRRKALQGETHASESFDALSTEFGTPREFEGEGGGSGYTQVDAYV